MNKCEILNNIKEEDIYKTTIEILKNNCGSNYKKVLIKPNLVADAENCVTTSRDMIMAVIDYFNKSQIVIADSPIESTNIYNVLKRKNLLFNEKVKFIDLRQQISKEYFLINNYKFYNRIISLGFVKYNNQIIDCERIPFKYVYQKNDRMHRSLPCVTKGELHISKVFFDCDIVINLPKLKTHRRSLFTGAAKNFVGAVSNKHVLPHYNDIKEPNYNLLDKLFRKLSLIRFDNFAIILKLEKTNSFSSGSYDYNETIQNMIAGIYNSFVKDLTVFTIVDSVVVGQGNGPTMCDPFYLGKIIFGSNMIDIDKICFEEIKNLKLAIGHKNTDFNKWQSIIWYNNV